VWGSYPVDLDGAPIDFGYGCAGATNGPAHRNAHAGSRARARAEHRSDGAWGTSDDDFGDLHLQHFSPCIDAAMNAAVPAGISTDLDGFDRFYDDLAVPDTGVGQSPLVDMGACEHHLIHEL
jgi:hypothetical protein